MFGWFVEEPLESNYYYKIKLCNKLTDKAEWRGLTKVGDDNATFIKLYFINILQLL